MTFCCHDLYRVSSWVLAITWRLREVIRPHTPQLPCDKVKTIAGSGSEAQHSSPSP